MYSAARDAEQMGRSVEKSSSIASRGLNLLQVAAKLGALAIAAGFGIAVVSAIRFQKAMNDVGSLTGASTKQIASMSKAVLNLSLTIPQTAQDMAGGLYYIASAGFSASDSLTILKSAARDATAGLGTTLQSSKLLVSVLDAYGLSASHANEVSDILFNTVRKGVLRFSDLTIITGQYIATAAALKVPLNDVQSALATMTLQGLTPARSATSLNGVLRGLLKPNADLQKAFRETGLSITDLANPAIGLHGVMLRLLQYTGGNTVAMGKLFSTIQASRGALLLINNDARIYNRLFGEMKNSTGAVDSAMAVQMRSFSQQLKLGENRLKAFAINVGTAAIPVLTQVFAAAVAGASAAWSAIVTLARALEPTGRALIQIGKDAETAFKSAMNVIAPVASLLIGGFVTGLNAISTGFSFLFGLFANNKGAVEAVTTAFMAFAITAGITAAIAGLETLYLKLLYVQDAAKASAAWDALSGAMSGLKTMANGLGMALSGASGGFGMMKQGAGELAGSLATPFVAVLALTAAFVVFTQGVSEAHREAKATIADLSKGVDKNSLTSLDDYANRMRDAATAAQQASDKTGGLANGLKFLYEMATPAKNSILDIRIAAGDLAKAAEDAQKQYNALYDTYSAVAQKLATHDASGGTSLMNVDEIDKWVLALRKAGVAVDGMNIDQLAAAVGQVSSQAGSGIPAVEDYSKALQTMADDAGTATEKVNALKAAFDALIGGPLAVFDATTKFSKGLADLTDQAKKGGQALDDTSKEGRALRDAFSGSIKDALGLAEAIGKVSGPQAELASLQKSAANIYMVAAAAGIGKDKLDALFQQFNIDPQSLKTAFSVSGVDDATAKIKKFQDTAKATKVNIDVKSAQANIDNILASMDRYAKTNPRAVATLGIADPKAGLADLANSFQFYIASNPKTYAWLNTLDPQAQALVLAQIAQQWRDAHPTTDATLTGGQAAEDALNLIARTRTAQIQVAISQGQAAVHNQPSNPGYHGQWGMVHQMAEGGVRQAMMGSGQGRVHWDEPSTGREAYVPQKGYPQRSIPIIKTAASWYGLDLYPKTEKATGIGSSLDPAQVARGGTNYFAGASTTSHTYDVNVNFNAPVYGVEDLQAEVSKAVVGAISDQWDGVARVIRRKEMSVK